MIALYGPAGVGKSTQAQLLAKKLGRKWLSAGQIIRDSGRFNDFTAKSAMIDQRTVVELIEEAVKAVADRGKEVVFDGQPGEPEQVEYWKEAGLIDKLECILVLKAPENILIEHLSGRGRADDNIENWKTKFRYFEQKICSFLTEMKRQNVLVLEVDGTGTVEEVEARVQDILKQNKIAF